MSKNFKNSFNDFLYQITKIENSNLYFQWNINCLNLLELPDY